ncbi:MAG: bifunctional ornithine acetyltransferase/N-acetylglutamate synthase, partial [Lachnospiraceae bacterium]|nr:bifunctional ornithine acetyltransferase/N-acetylglutamate synthase [Lachnospiraceae bacterium]
MKKIIGGVTAAQGFEAASAAAHIKYEGRTDMALVFSRTPCVTAGTFTTNVVKAAPVIWDRDLVNSGAPAHAVIVNSGIANACTGQEGMEYCRQTAQEAAACLGIEENSVLVGSTGVIGFQLPIDRIREGVRMLAAARRSGIEAGTEAAKAIMTTDTVHKETAYEIDLDGHKAVIGGMAKGSGMIHPNMCTMLSYVTTDAAIEKSLLQKALREIVAETFNMISVDGDTSTNDTLLVLANGLAGNPVIDDPKSDAYAAFYEA